MRNLIIKDKIEIYILRELLSSRSRFSFNSIYSNSILILTSLKKIMIL